VRVYLQMTVCVDVCVCVCVCVCVSECARAFLCMCVCVIVKICIKEVMPGPTPKLSLDQLKNLSKADKQLRAPNKKPLKSRAGSMTERLIIESAGEGGKPRKGEIPSWLSPRGEILRYQVRKQLSRSRNACVLSLMHACPHFITDQQEERCDQVGQCHPPAAA